MNWIEIDKLLHRMYTEWDGVDREEYYQSVEKKFNWTRNQTVTATDLIFKQQQKMNNQTVKNTHREKGKTND